jgi:hypothetical protein
MPPSNPVPGLPRKVKKKLKRRARRAARREFQPQIQLARQQVQQVRRSYDRELNSVEGATNIVDNALQAQLKQLKSSGLEGRYLRDAVQELTARRAELPTSEAFLKSDVRADRRTAVSDAKLTLAQERADKQTEAAQKYNSLLLGEFEDKAQRLERQRKAVQERNADKREDKGIPKDEREAAAHEVNRLLKLKPELREAIFVGSSIENEDGDEISVTQILADLEAKVRQAEGVGFAAARAAIERLRKMANKPARAWDIGKYVE